MQVFRLSADSDRFQFLELVESSDWNLINAIIIGQRPWSEWQPFRVRPATEPEDAQLPASDYPSLGGVDVFSRRAEKALKSLLADRGACYPLSCEEGEYVAFRPTALIDALDEKRSQIKCMPDGTIIDIRKHHFVEGSLTNATIFRLPQMPWGPTYVSETFVRAAHDAKLTGFSFESVGAA
jgi:hypothetical protein